MLTDVAYDIARQRVWIERCNGRDDYKHAIIQVEGKDVGYTSITVTDARSGIGEIGAYIGDLEAPKALTVFNFVGTLNHAFFTMRLHKLVNPYNCLERAYAAPAKVQRLPSCRGAERPHAEGRGAPRPCISSSNRRPNGRCFAQNSVMTVTGTAKRPYIAASNH